MWKVNYMIENNAKPKLRKDVVWKKEGKDGENVSLASYLGGPIRLLNPIAGKIVELSNGKNSVEDIIQEICKSFEDADEEIVKKDVHNFLTKLEKNQIIIYPDK